MSKSVKIFIFSVLMLLCTVKRIWKSGCMLVFFDFATSIHIRMFVLLSQILNINFHDEVMNHFVSYQEMMIIKKLQHFINYKFVNYFEEGRRWNFSYNFLFIFQKPQKERMFNISTFRLCAVALVGAKSSG